MWWSKTHFQPKGKTALIIGALQGIGVDIAQSLYSRDCTVVLVARREGALKEQVARITRIEGEKVTSHGARISYYVCDVSDYGKCSEMWNTLLFRMDLDPDFVFCCAGSSVPKLFADLTARDLASGMDVNYHTAANTVHCGHKAVLEKHSNVPRQQFKPRHLIFFSSTVAVFPFIGYGQYGPAKAALLALAVILRQELKPFNYRVLVIFAGNFKSEGFAEEQKTKPDITKQIEGPSKAILLAECCELVLDGLAKGYDSVYTDFVGWVLALSVLGMHTRCWGFFQVIASFLFLIIAPMFNGKLHADVRRFYNRRDNTGGI